MLNDKIIKLVVYLIRVWKSKDNRRLSSFSYSIILAVQIYLIQTHRKKILRSSHLVYSSESSAAKKRRETLLTPDFYRLLTHMRLRVYITIGHAFFFTPLLWLSIYECVVRGGRSERMEMTGRTWWVRERWRSGGAWRGELKRYKYAEISGDLWLCASKRRAGVSLEELIIISFDRRVDGKWRLCDNEGTIG